MFSSIVIVRLLRM